MELASCRVVDWATVASGAITGVVGIAGVVGTVVAAKIAGNSARESAKLSIGAESDSARLAEKRRVYARAIAALDAGFLAARSAISAATAVSDAAPGEASIDAAARLAEATAAFKAATETATYAVDELQLIAPLPDGALARQALINITSRDPTAEARNELLNVLRADLDEEAQQSALPE